MSDTSGVAYEKKSSAGLWIFLPIVLFLLVGAGLSFAAYVYAEPDLTALESMGAGFGGLAGIIVALFASLFGIILGLIGAVIGLVTAAGAVAVTIFFVGSPLIAIVLFYLLLRERRERNQMVDALNRFTIRAGE